MHDAVIFERLGVPAALLITEPFQPLADSFSRTLALAEPYHHAAVPHPISTKDDAELATLAAGVVDRIVEQLLGG